MQLYSFLMPFVSWRCSFDPSSEKTEKPISTNGTETNSSLSNYNFISDKQNVSWAWARESSEAIFTDCLRSHWDIIQFIKFAKTNTLFRSSSFFGAECYLINWLIKYSYAPFGDSFPFRSFGDSEELWHHFFVYWQILYEREIFWIRITFRYSESAIKYLFLVISNLNRWNKIFIRTANVFVSLLVCNCFERVNSKSTDSSPSFRIPIAFRLYYIY